MQYYRRWMDGDGDGDDDELAAMLVPMMMIATFFVGRLFCRPLQYHGEQRIIAHTRATFLFKFGAEVAHVFCAKSKSNRN